MVGGGGCYELPQGSQITNSKVTVGSFNAIIGIKGGGTGRKDGGWTPGGSSPTWTYTGTNNVTPQNLTLIGANQTDGYTPAHVGGAGVKILSSSGDRMDNILMQNIWGDSLEASIGGSANNMRLLGSSGQGNAFAFESDLSGVGIQYPTSMSINDSTWDGLLYFTTYNQGLVTFNNDTDLSGGLQLNGGNSITTADRDQRRYEFGLHRSLTEGKGGSASPVETDAPGTCRGHLCVTPTSPDCPTARLPDCPTARLPDCPTVSLGSG